MSFSDRVALGATLGFCILIYIHMSGRKKRYIYVDRNGQVRARYVRLLRIGRFELALTWILAAGEAQTP